MKPPARPSLPIAVVVSALLCFGLLLASALVMLRPRQPAPVAIAPQALSPVAEEELSDTLIASLEANMEIVGQHAELAMAPSQRKTYWSSMGHIGQVPTEVLDYAKLARTPGVSTICEIGFNGGHSSSVFLTANPKATLYSFDFASHSYSPVGLALFRRAYPKRFHFVKGSSFDTVPWFQAQNITCDLFSIDGDHSYEGLFTDFRNAMKVMRPGGVLVADDVSVMCEGCLRVWKEVVEAGYLKDERCADNGPQEEARASAAGIKRWCWGTVAKVTGPLDDKPLPHPADTLVFPTLSIDSALPEPGSLPWS